MDKSKQILDYFSLLNTKNTLGTSYLFIGDNLALVKEIFKLISCKQDIEFCNLCWDCKAIEKENHPDFFVVQPQATAIKIENIREAQQFLSLKGFRLKRKILFIKGGESFGLAAANAFLKTLEEPPQNSFIAICASKLEGILPTVISRCKKIFLPFLQGEDFQSSLDYLISDFFEGKRISFKDREEFSSFLKMLMHIFRDYLVSQVGSESQLLVREGHQTILRPYSVKETQDILDNILKIYSAYTSVNQNLALDLVKLKLM